MNIKWMYRHAGHQLGPYTGDEMHLLAALGLLQPEDILWPDGSNPGDAHAAASAIDFASLPKPQVTPPDWLADVQRSARTGPQTPAWPAVAMPDWLEDVRAVEGAAKSPGPSPIFEETTTPPAAPANPPMSTKSIAEPAATVPAEATILQQSPSSAGPIPEERVCSDLPHQPSRRKESVSDLVWRAEAAIHAWADMDVNKAVILSGDQEALRHDVAIHVILSLVENCGAGVSDHIWKHLEFVVENRRQYYLAAG
jgi:hypothetical protein